MKIAACIAALLLCGAAQAADDAKKGPPPPPLSRGMDPASDRDPFASTYRPLPSKPTAIVGATVLTGTGQQIDDGTVVLRDGKIEAVGKNLAPPTDAVVVEAKGKWVTPGIIDVHSHLGVYPAPGVSSRDDGNEMTDPNTAGVWAEHSIWPEDPGFDRARAGGVTSLEILPGSGNLFGGRGVVLKNVPSVTMQGMKFPGAPYSLKMACGENPKRVYGKKGKLPSTPMGSVYVYRKAWLDAAEYGRKWEIYRAKRDANDEKAEAPKRDLLLDTLVGVLKGEILVQNHCYGGYEMAVMLDIAREFGFRIAAFHHAIEGYKVAKLLASEGVCAAVWAERGAMKMEAYDVTADNAAILRQAKACVIIHSDDGMLIQHLPQEAAIAMGAALRSGIDIPRAEAIGWVTSNAAKAIGIADRVGTLEPGKMADVVVWSGDPFSVYTLAEKTYIDGALAYDRRDKKLRPKSDFELGQPGEGEFHP